ncbi:MAG: hypothetical protein WCL21_18080 [Mariniphaga sp.]
MSVCAFTSSASWRISDKRQKLNKHEVPGSASQMREIEALDGPLQFRPAIKSYLYNIGGKVRTTVTDNKKQ